MQTYLVLVIYLLLIMIIGYFINVMTVRMMGGWIYRLLVAPGVVIHELSHALGCLLTGARIKSINVFKRDGGQIEHTGSPIPVVGNVVISLMPVAVAVGILYFLSRYFAIESVNNFQFSILNFQSIFQFLNFQTETYGLWLKTYGLTSWQFWAFLYLIFNLIATMAPSKQDIKVIWWDLLVLVGIGYLLTLFGITISTSSILSILWLSLIYSIFILIIIVISYLLIKIL